MPPCESVIRIFLIIHIFQCKHIGTCYTYKFNPTIMFIHNIIKLFWVRIFGLDFIVVVVCHLCHRPKSSVLLDLEFPVSCRPLCPTCVAARSKRDYRRRGTAAVNPLTKLMCGLESGVLSSWPYITYLWVYCLLWFGVARRIFYQSWGRGGQCKCGGGTGHEGQVLGESTGWRPRGGRRGVKQGWGV